MGRTDKNSSVTPSSAATAAAATKADYNKKTSVDKLLRPSDGKQATLKDCVRVIVVGIMQPRSTTLVDLQPLYLHTRVLFTYLSDRPTGRITALRSVAAVVNTPSQLHTAAAAAARDVHRSPTDIT